MTCDAEEQNDPHQINISLENDKGNKRKRFFENGLNALLAHEHFMLLYVPENGAKMRVILPVSDRYHRNRIIKRINEATHIPSFYYALSHLWGLTEDNRYHWNDISEHVDDEDGQPAKPVSMRPEKRGTLLSMLRDHPDSYWWIDVLCARTDTPLDIMGDIYSCCLECIAMIDCEPDLIPQLHTMMDMRDDLDEAKWVLNNRSNKVPSKEFTEKYLHLITVLHTMMQSNWWNRVWTWQEMALPFGDVRLMAETGSHQPPNNTITVDDLRKFDRVIRQIIAIYNQRQRRRLNDKQKIIVQNASMLYDCLMEIEHGRRSNMQRMEKNKFSLAFFFLFRTFENSTRRCYDPCDYVYGVLGILQIQIPRMTDPNEVWKRFLSEVDNKLQAIFGKNSVTRPRISDRAYHVVDLRKAKAMSHVYRRLLTKYQY